jgi:osmotically-inducible protein OsmY
MRHDQPQQQAGRRERDDEHERRQGRFQQGRYWDEQQEPRQEPRRAFRSEDEDYESGRRGGQREFDRGRREEQEFGGFDEEPWARPKEFEPEGARRWREGEGARFGGASQRRTEFGRESGRGPRYGGDRYGSEEIFGQERGQGYSGYRRSQSGLPTQGWGGYPGRRENQSDYSSYRGEQAGSRFGGAEQGGRGGMYGGEGSYGAGAPWSGAGAYGGSSQQGGSQWGSGSQQSFRGKGPKGFTRSDDRLKELICESLTDDHDVDASEVSVDVKDGKVTLSGTVAERRQKYLIEEFVEETGGVKEVENQLRVRKEDQAHSATPGSQYGQTGQFGQTGGQTGQGAQTGQGGHGGQTGQSGKSGQSSHM